AVMRPSCGADSGSSRSQPAMQNSAPTAPARTDLLINLSMVPPRRGLGSAAWTKGNGRAAGAFTGFRCAAADLRPADRPAAFASISDSFAARPAETVRSRGPDPAATMMMHPLRPLLVAGLLAAAALLPQSPLNAQTTA